MSLQHAIPVYTTFICIALHRSRVPALVPVQIPRRTCTLENFLLFIILFLIFPKRSLIIDELLLHPERPFWVNSQSLSNKQNLCHWLLSVCGLSALCLRACEEWTSSYAVNGLNQLYETHVTCTCSSQSSFKYGQFYFKMIRVQHKSISNLCWVLSLLLVICLLFQKDLCHNGWHEVL